MAVTIAYVTEGSLAEKKRIKSGETLIAINQNEIHDILDYQFYLTETKVVLTIANAAGIERTVTIKKGQYDDIGLEFESYLMDKHQHCKNKCIFCFIDQLPKGMRQSLYFKDDDSRLSFLFGNYITLTNLTDHDVQRIIQMKISPINISVHTTNPDLRVKMMKNPNAGSSLRYLKQLTDAGIKINTQLVLCPGINDGEELARSLRDLGALYPSVQSIAMVPVGLTKFREGLFPLKPFDRESARDVIRIVHHFSDNMLQQCGCRIAYPADEFFIKAELPIPEAEYYGDFDQLENGVGMLALLKDEFTSALETEETTRVNRCVSIATGVASYPYLLQLTKMAEEKIKGLKVYVYPVINRFFGEMITVSGLITGQDLIATLKNQPLGEELFISLAMLRSEQDVFLDDISLTQVEKELGVPVCAVKSDGYELLDKLIGR